MLPSYYPSPFYIKGKCWSVHILSLVFIEVQLIYKVMLVLYSKVMQFHIHIHTHVLSHIIFVMIYYRTLNIVPLCAHTLKIEVPQLQKSDQDVC